MSGIPGRAGATLVAVGCLVPVLALVVGVVSLVVHYAVRTPVSPYQVVFSTPGTACGEGDAEDEELIVDEETGEGRVRASGAFSAEEVARVTGLSRRSPRTVG